MLNVEAIFNSLDGEYNGFRGAGELTTFIRLKGCNLSCTFCDTKYSQDGKIIGKLGRMRIEEITALSILEKVTITGGEPLLQDEVPSLISELLRKGCRVTVETNGTIAPPTIAYYSQQWHLFDRLRFVVDYKLPSSGEFTKMYSKIFTNLHPQDTIKFVIADIVDYDVAKHFIKVNKLEAKLVFSPAIEDQNNYSGWPRTLAEYMIADAELLEGVSYSLQIHKVLFPDAENER